MSTLKPTRLSPDTPQNVYDHPYFKNLIKRSQRYLAAGYPVHYTGPSGIGKTTLALHLAKKRNRPVLLINGNKDLSNEDLIGAYTGYRRKKLNDNFVRTVRKIEESVSEEWVNGRLYEAVKEGYTVVYDEFTRSQPETNNLFLSILEEGILPLYGTKRTESYIDVHPDFSIIFTSNPAEYAGVYQSQDALLDRMITLSLHSMDEEAEIAVVASRTSLSKEKSEKIVKFVNRVREIVEGADGEENLSLRASLMIAEVVRKYNLKVKGSSEEFQDICLDITLYPLQMGTHFSVPFEELKEQVLEECRKV
ncbi:gas vesicle protein GvpN [Halobacillus massiliensis]|uniref:gas vesicle protein GvpN n=1 Tax=Halobacillus massiliensis TaxID=1926286 RepID=UPI0009E2DBB3|nr:gas vesicle protein GvpN [Halobacillus massiliensis]